MHSIARFLQAPRRGPSFVNLLGELLAITNRSLCERDLTSLCSRSCEATRVAVAMPMNANQHPYPLTQTRFDEHDASFSPDGRWITYSSDESGKTEVYVAPFSTPQDRFQISSGGGQTPRWNREGNRIYYMAQDGKVMEVPLKIGSRVDASSPTLVFQAPRGAEYGVLPDGKFVTLENTYNGSSAVATLNWYVGANIKH
jgi:hypothetical protein